MMPTEITGTASGRLEALGNHTDYNQGLFLPMGFELNLEISANCFLRLNPKSDGSHIQQTLYR
jgi:galactokinase